MPRNKGEKSKRQLNVVGDSVEVEWLKPRNWMQPPREDLLCTERRIQGPPTFISIIHGGGGSLPSTRIHKSLPHP